MTESEWVLGNQPPFIRGAVFRIWTEDDNVRTVRYEPEMYGSALLFTDCKHPMQHALCSLSYIRAWKLANG